MKKTMFLIALLVLMTAATAYAVRSQRPVEYAKTTSASSYTSAAGTLMQGDALVCIWPTSGGSVDGTYTLQIKFDDGNGSGEWISTGDSWTAEGCEVVAIPDSAVYVRVARSGGSADVNVRVSQEYPPKFRLWRD